MCQDRDQGCADREDRYDSKGLSLISPHVVAPASAWSVRTLGRKLGRKRRAAQRLWPFRLSPLASGALARYFPIERSELVSDARWASAPHGDRLPCVAGSPARETTSSRSGREPLWRKCREGRRPRDSLHTFRLKTWYDGRGQAWPERSVPARSRTPCMLRESPMALLANRMQCGGAERGRCLHDASSGRGSIPVPRGA